MESAEAADAAHAAAQAAGADEQGASVSPLSGARGGFFQAVSGAAATLLTSLADAQGRLTSLEAARVLSEAVLAMPATPEEEEEEEEEEEKKVTAVMLAPVTGHELEQGKTADVVEGEHAGSESGFAAAEPVAVIEPKMTNAGASAGDGDRQELGGGPGELTEVAVPQGGPEREDEADAEDTGEPESALFFDDADAESSEPGEGRQPEGPAAEACTGRKTGLAGLAQGVAAEQVAQGPVGGGQAPGPAADQADGEAQKVGGEGKPSSVSERQAEAMSGTESTVDQATVFEEQPGGKDKPPSESASQVQGQLADTEIWSSGGHDSEGGDEAAGVTGGGAGESGGGGGKEGAALEGPPGGEAEHAAPLEPPAGGDHNTAPEAQPSEAEPPGRETKVPSESVAAKDQDGEGSQDGQVLPGTGGGDGGDGGDDGAVGGDDDGGHDSDAEETTTWVQCDACDQWHECSPGWVEGDFQGEWTCKDAPVHEECRSIPQGKSAAALAATAHVMAVTSLAPGHAQRPLLVLPGGIQPPTISSKTAARRAGRGAASAVNKPRKRLATPKGSSSSSSSSSRGKGRVGGGSKAATSSGATRKRGTRTPAGKIVGKKRKALASSGGGERGVRTGSRKRKTPDEPSPSPDSSTGRKRRRTNSSHPSTSASEVPATPPPPPSGSSSTKAVREKVFRRGERRSVRLVIMELAKQST